jgi:dienelactone hydrolase
MLSKWAKIKNGITTQLLRIVPGENAVKGASLALILTSVIFFILFSLTAASDAKDLWLFAFFVTLAGLFVLNAYLTSWLIAKINSIPKNYKIAILVSTPLLFFSLAFEGLYWFAALLISSLLGAAIAVFASGDFRTLSKVKKTITVIGGLLGSAGLVGAIIGYLPIGFDIKPVVNAASLNIEKIQSLSGPSPAEKGPYTVKTLTYGSGTDKHRAEFAEAVVIKTDSVDGVPFLDNWSGLSGWYREQFWGFDAAELPLNAYVWYPEGEGPFPVILMVHGNHLMSDFSDVGYAYLGELLASRGYIFASVDENFINGAWSDITGELEEENDARGWILLEHLRLWHEWNENEESPFYSKVDTEKLALIGHSRGGEAVAHAALLNKMPYYYDDATIQFEFNFNIESIVAIAPVDGQYEPGESRTTLTDINYLVIHGAQDGDVSSFAGTKQYQRINFSKDSDHFKASLYIQGANHGQFNTSWGDNDSIAATKLLNNQQLLAAEEQRNIAEVYISAFMDSTLQKDQNYLPLFADARKGKDWLPHTIYLNQYETANFHPVATFDEDFNVETSSYGGLISATNLSVWREQEVKYKWGDNGTRAAYVGWHYDDIEDQELITEDLVASYTIETVDIQKSIAEKNAFVFSLAESDEKSDPKSFGKWQKNSAANNEQTTDPESEDGDSKDEKPEDPETPQDPIDFTIIMEDTLGEKIVFPLSQFSALQRNIQVRIWKSQFITGENESENIFQTFHFPLSEIQPYNPNLDFTHLQSVTFKFDKTPKGVVIVDNLGFM